MAVPDDVLPDLLAAYDARAAWRDAQELPAWRLAERQSFLDRLRAAGLHRLVERDFEIVDFHTLDVGRRLRFQSLTLRPR